MAAVSKIVAVILFIYFIIVCVYLYMHMYNFLCSDSLLYTSFFFFLLYIVFIHVIVHVSGLVTVYLRT